jgi:hypothetical protein
MDLHPTTQQPVDMTYGRGAMWKGVRGPQPLRCDGNPDLPDLDICALWHNLPVILGTRRANSWSAIRSTSTTSASPAPGATSRSGPRALPRTARSSSCLAS